MFNEFSNSYRYKAERQKKHNTTREKTYKLRTKETYNEVHAEINTAAAAAETALCVTVQIYAT